MSNYVITGVSRGLGWEFLTQISSDSKNNVIGIVRNKAGTEKRIADELPGRSNITILEADLTKHADIKRVAKEAATVNGGVVDILIANAGYVGYFDAFEPIGDLNKDDDELDFEFAKYMNTNVLSNIHLFHAFLPQVLNSKVKKIITLASGHSDLSLVREWDIDLAAIYTASKAAMDIITAKFSAQYKSQGVLFLGISPGMVDVGHYKSLTPEQEKALGGLLAKFTAYAGPDWTGPITPAQSISMMLSVIDKSSVEGGQAGEMLSHYGNKKWL